RDRWIVEAHWGFPSGYIQAAFIKLHADGARNVLLTLFDKRLERQPFGREPETVIDQLALLGNELVPQLHYLSINVERVDLATFKMHNCSSRGLIDSAVLHSDKSVLAHINPSNAVPASEPIQGSHDAQWSHRCPIDRDGVAPLEVDCDMLRL